VPNAIKVFDYLKEKGYKPKGIRLDSGDLAYLSKKARQMLDKAGYPDAKICASGDLDEYSINSLKNQGAQINSWGVGTRLITSADMPALGGVYKLAAIIDKDGNVTPKIKLSNNTAKITNPGFKNIYRVYDKATGKAEADVICLRDEKEVDESKPLVLTHPTERWKKTTYTNYQVRTLQEQIIKDGKLVYDMPTLKEIKAYAKRELESFWDEYKRLDRPHLYKVDLSDDLYELKRTLLEKIRGV
jgi:nicotinate phosphoribosyltransferase